MREVGRKTCVSKTAERENDPSTENSSGKKKKSIPAQALKKKDYSKSSGVEMMKEKKNRNRV